MNDYGINTSKWRKIGGSIMHLFIYVSLLTLVSYAASAQCDEVSLACNNSINISTNDACIAELCTDLMLENSISGYTDADFSFSITDAMGTSTGLALANGCIEVNESHVGMILKATVTLDPCGVSCWGYINVEDKVGPRFLDCIAGQEFGLGESDISCEDFIMGVGVVNPALAGSCSDLSLSHTDEDSGIQCTGPFSGSIVRTWTATDGAGNSSTCQQKFNILKFDVEDVVFPEDTIHFLNSNCDFPDTSPESLGLPMGVQCPNIMFSYTDIVTETCGAQEKFLRDWFVIDWCTGSSVTDGQVVKVIDALPPITNCPQDTVFFPAIGSTCSAKVVLDPFGTIDNSSAPAFVLDCSAPFTLAVEFLPAIPGTNQPALGPYQPVPMDSDSLFTIPQLVEQAVWVRYCFTDDCGNGAQINDEQDPSIAVPDFVNCCFFEIQVSDNLRPTAICEGFTKVSLGPDGTASALAETFDDHSFDACGSVTSFEARRVASHSCGGGTTFGDRINFCCTDLGDTIDVLLRVMDDDGNSSICSSRVCVADPTVPILSCPSDVTIDCEDDFRDPALIGSASGVDGCNVTFTVDEDSFNLDDYDDSCRMGEILRTITIRSNAGNVLRTCNQVITVVGNSISATLESDDFTRPANTSVDLCDGSGLDPEITGFPETTKDFGCINLGITYEDSNPITSTQAGVCHTIVRTWLIVDWCRFDAAFPDRFSITFTQNISVRNSGTPTLTCPDMSMVSVSDNTCRGDIDLDIFVTDACGSGSVVEWSIDADSDGMVDLTGIGTSASGNYPVGEHSVTFTAYNECQGEPTSCTFPFIVKGDRPPLPICLSSITWTISDLGSAVVSASDFDLKSEGGCDGTDSLTFSFVSPLEITFPSPTLEFGCDDLTDGVAEMINLEVFIVDQSGNFESCVVILDLQDSNDVCLNVGSRSAITGVVKTESNDALDNVMIHLDDMTNVADEMQMTNSIGSYAFEDVEYYNDYMIQPDHNVDPLNGVSTLDLVKIQRHILGLELLDSPYKMIAADINNDDKISGTDLVQLQKLILGIFTEYPQNKSWTFVSDQYEFADPTAPWGYDENFHVEQLQVSSLDVNFTAVKIGDVNGSAIAGQKVGKRSNSDFYLTALDQSFESGDLVSVPFVVEEAAVVSGMQFTLKFDHNNLVFQGIDGADVNITSENFALLNNHDGTITFSMSNPSGLDLRANDNIFTAYFEAKSAGKLSEVIEINSDHLDSEAYDMNDEILNVEYVITSEAVLESSNLELFQNQPNPFSDNTSIAFYVPKRQLVKLTVFGSDGKVILRDQAAFDKGINNFKINGSDLSSEGILLYRLDSENSSQTNKMIFIR